MQPESKLNLPCIRNHGSDRAGTKSDRSREHSDSSAARMPNRAMRLLASHIRASPAERLQEYDRWGRGEASLKQPHPVLMRIHLSEKPIG